MPSDNVITAYDNHAPEHQEQNLPGLDSKMTPLASHTKVEKWDENGKPYLDEYQGNGKLKGKTALVTGGDSGIGRSVALFFAREGAHVSIAYLPAEESDAQDVVKMAKENPTGEKEIHLIQCDQTKEDQIKATIDSHLKKWGRLDILVNNASVQIMEQDISKIDLSNSELILRTNLFGMIAFCKYAKPHLRRGSCIINSSSVTARKGSTGMVEYSATKGGIDSLTRSLALQFKEEGIRVNAVAPGPVYTPLQPVGIGLHFICYW